MLLLLVSLLVGGRALAAPVDANSNSTSNSTFDADDLFELSIVHINDFHARFEQVAYDGGVCKAGQEAQCVGGIARVAAQATQLLRERPNALLLNAGDNYQGTLWFNEYGWNVTVDFLNRLPWDAVTLGNHEFDNKIDGVIPYLENLEAPIVVANIDDSKEPSIQGLYNKTIVVERGGRKIGIIGIITSTTKDISSPEELEFVPEAEAVAVEGARLKAEGVDIVVVLSHAGIEVDVLLAASDPYADVIVGGHSHTLMYTGTAPSGETPYYDYPHVVTQPSGRKVAVVQAFCYSRYLGNMVAYFDDVGELVSAGGAPIYLDKNVEPDPEILDALIPWAKGLEEMAKEELGLSAVLLEQVGGVCYEGECNLGSFVADAMVHSFASDGGNASGPWTRAAIAITNAGGLRAPISPGVVTYNDLMTTLPFGNTVDLLEVRGAGLRRAMEEAVASAALQVSGLHVQYYKDPADGKRIHSIEVLCHNCTVPKYEPLDDGEWYPVAINNFLARGGDGYHVFVEEGRNHVEGEVDAAVVRKYLKTQMPVVQGRDGRIAFVDKECSGAATPTSPTAKAALALLAAFLVSLR